MVYGDEVCAGGECAFDHDFCERRGHGGQDVAAAEHGAADGHEV